MAGKIKGITIEIAGKTSDLVNNLEAADKALNKTQNALKAVDKALELDPTNTELITQKQELLANAVTETKQRLDALKQAAELAAKGLEDGTTTREQYATLTAEITKTEKSLQDLGENAADAGDKVDDLGEDTKEASDEAEKGSVSWEKFGSAALKAAEAAGAAIAAAAAAAGKLVFDAVEGYAEIEQLEGGIEKLFGANATQVIQNANDAFLTAGMSASEYMSTATGISAALINSLGGDTAAAADMADTAIRAMSDNASVFGTDLSTLQSAFLGFSRGQFTMLDSLSLGYSGSQEGMLQLINDSGLFTEQIESLENIDFATMVQAIDAVQTQMQIAGNTESEALKTISGSVNATKAAWENWVTGLADDNADVEQLTDNLVTAGMAALENIEPAIEQALAGLETALPLITEVVSDNLPTILNDLFPPLIEAAEGLLSSLGEALPGLLSIFIEEMPEILELGSQILEKLAMGLLTALPELTPTIIEVLMGIVNFAVENIDLILDISFQIFETLISGISSNLPVLLPAVVSIINSINSFALSHIDELIVMAGQLILGLVTGFLSSTPEILSGVGQVVSSILGGIRDLGPELVDTALTWGSDLIDNFISGISNAAGRLWDTLVGIGETIKSYIGFSVPEAGPLHEWAINNPGEDMVKFWDEGVERNLGDVKATMAVFGQTVEAGAAAASPNYSGILGSIGAGIGQLAAGGTVPINIYLNGDLVDTQRANFISGGR